MKKAMQKTTSLPEFLKKFKDVELETGPLFRFGDECPNCHKDKLTMTPMTKSIYEMRYIYYLFCRACGFRQLKKAAVTGSGKPKRTDFSFHELELMRKQGIKI
jgi:C4-type Zn-finger protein